MSGLSMSSHPYNTVALYNAKGGTGKTTIGINVAGALNERGLDVLFVDLDPQGNATEGLGMVEEYDADPPTMFDVLFEDEDATNLVRSHQEFDVLPSNVDMLNAERELVIDDFQGHDSHEYLYNALDGMSGGYDVVLIDAPPFFGELTDSALFAARNVLIPALTESTSERAVELLLDQMEHLEREYDVRVREVGAVANRVETTNEAERMKDWMRRAFPDVPVFNIRKRVALQRAYSEGVSIFEYKPSSDMAPRFLDIADAIIDHFEVDHE